MTFKIKIRLISYWVKIGHMDFADILVRRYFGGGK